MMRWQARPCVPADLAAVWLTSILCFTFLVVADAAAHPHMPECQLTVTVGQAGQITAASMSCQGRTQTDIAVESKLLGNFQADFTGVSATSSCRPKAGCLITVCSGTSVLRDSSVSWVAGRPLDNLVCVLGSSHVELHNSRFMHNAVRPLACFDQSHLVLHNSSLSHNSVRPGSGGGLSAEGGATVVITDGSRVHNNSAGQFGGGVLASGKSNVTLTGGSSVTNNVAQNGSGGGVAVMEDASLTISGGSSVNNNSATRSGGGVIARNNTVVRMTGSSMVHNNAAGGQGGGVSVVGNAGVTITGGSSVHNHGARNEFGGGVVAFDHTTVVIRDRSILHSNTAQGGGGVAAWDNASVTITGGSSVHNNVAWNSSGGGLAVAHNASVTIIGGSNVHNNAAKFGGGLLVRHDASVTLSAGSSVHSNIAYHGGGGAAASDNASVTLADRSSVHNNTAWQYGGGIDAGGNSSVIIINQSQVHDNLAGNGSGGGLFVTDWAVVRISGISRVVANSCSKGIGGGIAVGMVVVRIKFGDKGLRSQDAVFHVAGSVLSAAHVHISNSTIGNNTSYLSAGGGLAVASSATVELTNGTQVVGNRAVNGSGGGVVLIDCAVLKADGSVAFAHNAVNRGYVGATLAALDSSILQTPLRGNLTKCSVGVCLGRTPCEEGETLVYDVCTCCQRHTYNFDNSTACALCPLNGICPGGSLVDPTPGYWQSSSRSIEMHRCPLFVTSCNHTVTQAGTVQTCNPGYQGNLCGACQLPDYGMVSPLRCGKCMRPAVQLGLYLLACFATVVLIAYTVHATWQDNLQGDQSVRATDVIKVLVQFLQYVVIIGSVSIPWPAGFDLQRWFHLASSVFGASSGEALSLDCWLYRYIPQLPKGVLHLAIQRQLVYFLAPAGVLVGVMVLQCLTWAVARYMLPLMCRCREELTTRGRGAFMVVRKLPVTVLVLTYYSYPTLLKASLGFFACSPIDRATAKPGLPAPLNHPLGYWVNDIQQACFAGYHLGWALGLGLPSILLWCIVVPIVMGMGFKLAGNKVNSDSFREHFGFLYRNYKPERIWWEAVWAARTVVLILVSVFAFPMDSYFSVLALLVVFLASAALQLVLKPYAMSTLHNMHMVSTACLAATTLGALAMFDVQQNTAERLRHIITSLVLLINVVFVGWCLARLAPATKQWCIRVVSIVKAWGWRTVGAIVGHRSKATYWQQSSTHHSSAQAG